MIMNLSVLIIFLYLYVIKLFLNEEYFIIGLNFEGLQEARMHTLLEDTKSL